MAITIEKTSSEGWADDFNRADSETVGNGWDDNDSNNWRISSNKLLQDTGSGNNEIYQTRDVDEDGEETYIVKWTLGTTTSTSFVFRKNTDAGLKFYQMSCDASLNRTHFYYYDAGFTRIVSSAIGIGVVGTVRWFKLLCNNYVFTCYYSTDGVSWTQMTWGTPVSGGSDLTVTDTNSTSLHGTFGWRGTGNNGMTIDEITVAPDYVTIENIALDSFLDGVSSNHDSFDRADSETVGGIWDDDGADSWKITDNTLHHDATDADEIFATGVDYTDTCIALRLNWLENGAMSFFLRRNTDSGLVFYQMTIDNTAGNIKLYVYDAGFSLVEEDTSVPSWSTGVNKEFMFSIQGSILRCSYWGTNGWTNSITYEDTSNTTTHGYIGFRDCKQIKVEEISILPYRQFNMFYNNPEVDPDEIPVATNDNCYAPNIVYFNGAWRRYFGCFHADGKDRIYHQSSSDLLTWTSPVLVLDIATPSAFDDTHVNDPNCVVDGSTLYMYYTGATGSPGPSGELPAEVGLATTTNGTTFTREATNPVITKGGSGDWNEEFVARPAVIIEGSTWKLWCDGVNAAPDPLQRTIGYYTSTDGISWTEYGSNPVYIPATRHTGAIFVMKEGSTYYMFETTIRDVTIWYVTSTDGTSWTEKGLFLPSPVDTEGDWNGGALTPFFIHSGKTQQLYWGGPFEPSPWSTMMIISAYLHRKVDIQLSGRSVVNEILAVNGTDVRVSTTNIGSVTIKVYNDLAGTTEDVSDTFTLARGDVYRVSGPLNLAVIHYHRLRDGLV